MPRSMKSSERRSLVRTNTAFREKRSQVNFGQRNAPRKRDHASSAQFGRNSYCVTCAGQTAKAAGAVKQKVQTTTDFTIAVNGRNMVLDVVRFSEMKAWTHIVSGE